MPLDTSRWGRDDLIREARLQTSAIRRLEVFLRMAYSALAIGFLLGWWGFYGAGGSATGVAGVALLVMGALASAVLKLGTTRARANVGRILDAAEAAGDERLAKNDGAPSAGDVQPCPAAQRKRG